MAIENVVGLVGEGFTRVVAEGIKFQIGLAGDDSVPAAFYEAFADRGPSGRMQPPVFVVIGLQFAATISTGGFAVMIKG